MIYSGTTALFSDSYLAHEGKKRRSGRYPYGSGEDPYQHDPGHHSAKAARQAAKDAKKTKRKADRIKSRRAKKEKLAAQEAKKQAEEAQKQEEAKMKAIASGDPKEISKYANSMTNTELDYALQRIDKTKKLRELGVDTTERTKLKNAEANVTEFFKHVDTVTSWINSANKMYTQLNNATVNVKAIKNKEFGKTKEQIKDEKKDK